MCSTANSVWTATSTLCNSTLAHDVNWFCTTSERPSLLASLVVDFYENKTIFTETCLFIYANDLTDQNFKRFATHTVKNDIF
jgi:hypothetical protein